MSANPQQPEPPGPRRLRWLLSRPWVWVVFLLLLAVSLVAECSEVAYWIGSQEVELRFVVVDADTGAPVEGATVLVSRQYRTEERPAEARTGPDGTARVVIDCTTAGRSGLFVNDGSADFGAWQFEVLKDGYGRAGPLELIESTGREAARLKNLPPPPIPVELKKEPGKN